MERRTWMWQLRTRLSHEAGGRQTARLAGPMLVAAVGVWLTMAAPSAHAQLRTLERLVMPGLLASAHAEYEKECVTCHVRFERGSQRQLCLDCHEEIADDLATRTGFHSRSPGAANQECSSCHTDHEGREANIVGLDEAAFDHDLTDFALLGKHAETTCVDCHAADRTFHDAETDCNACHREDDRHRGNLGPACNDCHSETGWKEVHFDHEMTAMYALTGRHAEIPTCVSCHVDEQYENTPDTCVGCHRDDDEHMGLNGLKCETCHATTDWKDSRFDHLQRTGFALRGGHSGLTCESCHEGNKFEAKPAKECYGCHADDDSHDGVNGTACADCHRVTTWPDATFDHARDAEFALNGAHADLECGSCHVERVAVALPAKECFGCHEDEDPHVAQLGQSCGSCHGEIEWKRDVRFDHDLSRFPLLGRHREAVCEDCHATPAFLDAEEACVDCHLEDDVHTRRLGGDCALCHNPSDWRSWLFDHDTQTEFKLDGAHGELDCHACHREPVAAASAISLSTSCGSCHRKDDVHRGGFGQQCEQCHTTESFGALREVR